MGLKLLVFPAIISLSLILAVMFIQPDVMSILEQREIESTKQDALSKIEMVAKNIQSMSSSLDSKKEAELLIKRYYPERVDQERAVDMVNFLAQQSGVIVTKISLVEQENKKKAPSQSHGEGTSGSEEIDILSTTEPAVEPPKSYKVDVIVMGTYDGIRGFFERLYRTDRLRVMNFFSIQEISLKTEKEGESIPDNFLEGSISFDFRYVAQKRAGNVLHHPLFQSESLDYSTANQLADFINSPVSDLTVPTTGRSNPFEKMP